MALPLFYTCKIGSQLSFDLWLLFTFSTKPFSIFSSPGLEVQFSTQDGAGSNRQPPVSEEDDDGFIEDNYIPTGDQVRAVRAAENVEDTDDTEDEMDEIVFSVA